ncbi:hypothetical protein UFOVP254_50 [uncultured Caudovirales phage]|uniref:Gene product 88 domain-containing protein n=1 Tax=uncultured Caudovirales phage TaxID=2100421 RepID=A0A6J5KW35_9CAUD|nr:hypothetical protein UFOVP76_3 [uncultured Caudovirales phage]CAB4133123.1 hypothetical protein UFOVP254_50 [uncultured Caudovirales phage]
MALQLLTVDSPKTRKGESLGYLTGILYLAPSDESGRNVCPFALRSGETASAIKSACSRSCLTFAGKGNLPKVRAARVRKTRFYFEDRQAFLDTIRADVRKLQAIAARDGWAGLVVRLDGTSDLGLAEKLAGEFPDVQFVDYTKDPSRAMRARMVPNWHVTYSAHEHTTQAQVDYLIAHGVNVSMVFAGKTLPETYMGHSVIDGDSTDLRHLDPIGRIVGLRMKGVSNAFKAAAAVSGFARVIPLKLAA